MAEFKLSGLSCAHCAQEMETQMRKLKHGEDAKIMYNSGKMVISDKMAMADVEKILQQEGVAASPMAGGHEDHDHNHDHGDTSLIVQIAISTILFFVAMLTDKYLPTWGTFSIYFVAAALSGYQTFFKGLKNLFRLKFNIDTLMTVALVGAFIIGDWGEGTVVAILFGVNEYLEGFGMRQARKSMAALLKVVPKTANLLKDGVTSEVPIDQLRLGDTVLIRAGDKVPSDATIVDGRSSVNEAAITGESMPVEKQVGDALFGGSVNNEGTLKAEITAIYADSSLAKILHLVEEAQETKTPTELFIDKFARYYTPIIMLFAVLVTIVPPLLFGGAWSHWVYEGLAVLIIGCPCALILSSPVAIVSGITRSAKNGVLIKGGVFLEQLAKTKQIAFDKTGTLTEGKPVVAKEITYDDANFFQISGMMEQSSSHPIAKAIMDHIGDTKLAEMEQLTTVGGKGLGGTFEGKQYFLGNEQQIPEASWTEQARADVAQLKQDGYTVVITASENTILGMFGIQDALRKESKQLVQQLHHEGITNIIMLTGDHEKTAEKVAKEIGIDNYYAGLLPEDKLTKIQQLHDQNGNIAMVGDGINDSPALATADLGIAMGKGTDSAIEVADIVLMQDHLGKLPLTVKIAKKVRFVVGFNIAFALGLKILALLLALTGYLTLWMAIMADMGATIIVTIFGLSILFRTKAEKELQ
ncbi:heavy metal translocating P-type ATPase [Listeria booriae]|uniref:heavy metal translocating P-type ATPase n=1 Tax=Listeria booriae TaxID=1552123 RepID=UPI001627D7D6|nr:cation-translocating P-type ATPase [Listeria booriae]MBC1975392.1 cadmium-translocating P-type ATPase [Listeria booriae]MBC2032931.1 cadmium-translocating P-type ATPase [Listeria booriae]MBC2048668.1 cadmium-translocating P-type ATPase [Listeria booriae]